MSNEQCAMCNRQSSTKRRPPSLRPSPRAVHLSGATARGEGSARGQSNSTVLRSLLPRPLPMNLPGSAGIPAGELVAAFSPARMPALPGSWMNRNRTADRAGPQRIAKTTRISSLRSEQRRSAADGDRPRSGSRRCRPSRSAVLLGCLFAGFVLSSVSIVTAAVNLPETLNSLVAAEYPSLEKLYQEFHAHPELPFQEKQTAAKLAAEFRSLGIEVATGVGGHGVVGILRNGPGPTILLRTDLDALPVK